MRSYIAIALLVLGAGCAGENAPIPTKPASAMNPSVEALPPPAPVPDAGKVLALATTADEGAWGTIRGQVVYAGTPPPRDKLNVNKDEDHCLAKGPLLSEKWVVNPANNGVQWGVAFLKAAPGAKLPIHPTLEGAKLPDVILDQPMCQYEPHVVALRAGQKLVAKNPTKDKVHNVYIAGFKNQHNQTIPAGGKYTFDLRPERNAIKLACTIHPWMDGWAWVFDHPYYAVTDADGKFEIKLAPTGKQTLMIWHEEVGYIGGGPKGREIEIKPGEAIDLGKVEVKKK